MCIRDSSPHREDELGLIRTGLDFRAQSVDVRIDGVLVTAVAIAPNLVEELGAAENAARMLGKVQQQVELLGGEKMCIRDRGYTSYFQPNKVDRFAVDDPKAKKETFVGSITFAVAVSYTHLDVYKRQSSFLFQITYFYAV